MSKQEYEEIMCALRNKKENRPYEYRLGRQADGFKAGILAAMSIISSYKGKV